MAKTLTKPTINNSGTKAAVTNKIKTNNDSSTKPSSAVKENKPKTNSKPKTDDPAKNEKAMSYTKKNGVTYGPKGKKIGRPKKKKKEKKVQLSFNVSTELKDELNACANEKGMPLSMLVSLAAQEYLNNNKK